MSKILLVLLFIAYESNAQEVLTYADCLQRAMQNNLAIKSASYDEKAAMYEKRASYGKLLPSIFGEGENRNSWGKDIDSDTNLFVNQEIRNNEGTLNAYFTLFSGFANLNNIQRTKQVLELNKSNVQRIRNEVSIDLARRYITILYLKEIIDANGQQIKSSEKQLELADFKFSSGAISESEVFKIKSQKASEELRLLNFQNQLNENMIALKQLMNMPLTTDITLLQPQLDLNENLVGDMDENTLAERAVQNHPMYKMSLWEQKIAKSELNLARSPMFPTFTMRLMYRTNYSTTDFANIPFSTQLDENTSRGIRFYLTIPIFSQMENYGKIQSGKMRLMRSKVETKMEHDRLSKEVLLAISNAKTSLKKNEASSKAYEFSQKSFDADALKFELGKININELNTSKIIYNNTQADLIQSKYELLFNNALIRFYLGEEFSL